jgi:hypothetical protein
MTQTNFLNRLNMDKKQNLIVILIRCSGLKNYLKKFYAKNLEKMWKQKSLKFPLLYNNTPANSLGFFS